MDNQLRFTPSQIRYIIWILRLSKDGVGVKNVELATALDYSKPSVHNMLRSIADMGVVTQESFGLAHFTETGRIIAKKYEVCFEVLKSKMRELCGDNAVTESAICGILADMPYGKINELYKANESISERD